MLPVATEGADPSWFGFPLGVRADAPFTRDQLDRALEAEKIGTRLCSRVISCASRRTRISNFV